MAEDIKVMGTTYYSVPEIILPRWNGDDAHFYALNDTVEWLGPYAEDLGTYYEADYTLDETNFPNIATSTSAVTAQPSKTGSLTATLDTEHYAYYIRWNTDINVAYDGTEDGKAKVNRYCASQWQQVHRRPYGIPNLQTMTPSYNYVAAASTASSYTFYNNASGTSTWTSGLAYGLYAGNVAATLSSTSSKTPVLTFKSPTLMTRTATTYMKSANWAKIDQENTTIRFRGELFRMKYEFAPMVNYYNAALDIYNYPIPPLE